MIDVSLDVRHALRGLRRGRTLTATTVIILAVGIGSATAMYAVVEQVLLRPLPVRDQSRLVVSWGAFQTSKFEHVPLSYSDLTAIGQRTRVFQQVAGLDYNGSWSVVGRAGREAIPLRLGVVAGDFFATLGVRATLGRTLEASDDQVGRPPIAVISRGLWLRRFGGDSATIGKTLPIWTTAYTIVGVMPGDFQLQGADAWVPVSVIRPALVTNQAYGTFDLVGRLRDGYTAGDAKKELDRLLMEIQPNAWPADSRLTAVVHLLSDVVVGRVRPALVVLLSAALLVFLVAALNLSGILVVRTVERRQEFALRRALGGTRLALVRQIMIEGAVIVGLGGLLGIALAWGALHLIPVMAPDDLPRIDQLELRPGVILVSLGLAMTGVLLAGLLPVHSIRESDLALPRGGAAVPSDNPSRVPARSIAVAAQVASAIATVAIALLLMKSLSQLQRLESGFNPAGLTIFQVAFLSPRIDTDEQVFAAMDQVIAEARSVPGVTGAAAVLQPPLSGTGGYDYGFVAEGQTETQAAANPYLNYEAVTADYFATFGLPILRGRALNDADRASSTPVVVVSRGLASRMWPGQDPLGKRLRWAGDTAEVWRTVVGVVNDSRYRELLQLRPTVYVPMQQQPWVPAFLIVRSNLPLDALSLSIRNRLRAADPDLAVVNASAITALLARPLAQPRFNAAVLAAFGIVAVLLAAIGLYGLVSFAVAQRTREVGIRLAVGAQGRQIVTMFVKRGLAPVVVGCGIGVIAVLAGGRLVSSLLYGVTATDPAAIIGAVIGFALVAVVATLIPARRAAQSDPAAALRLE